MDTIHGLLTVLLSCTYVALLPGCTNQQETAVQQEAQQVVDTETEDSTLRNFYELGAKTSSQVHYRVIEGMSLSLTIMRSRDGQGTTQENAMAQIADSMWNGVRQVFIEPYLDEGIPEPSEQLINAHQSCIHGYDRVTDRTNVKILRYIGSCREEEPEATCDAIESTLSLMPERAAEVREVIIVDLESCISGF